MNGGLPTSGAEISMNTNSYTHIASPQLSDDEPMVITFNLYTKVSVDLKSYIK